MRREAAKEREFRSIFDCSTTQPPQSSRYPRSSAFSNAGLQSKRFLINSYCRKAAAVHRRIAFAGNLHGLLYREGTAGTPMTAK
jgi:hypothetical protein